MRKVFQHPHLLVILLILNLRATCEHSTRMKDGTRCLEKEREALLKFKDELIDEYGRFSSWGNHNYKKDCCEWRGVLCDNLTNHIIELDLNGPYENREKSVATAPLRGNISIWLLEIQNLKHLDLSFNDFNYSRIPQFIGSLSKLQYLDLSHSNFSGEIPRHLGNLSQLQFLGLGTDDGMLTSTNLDWLSRLHSLSYLIMSSVNLTMATNWLQTITKFTQLEVLSLPYCNLQNVRPPSPTMINASSSLSAINFKGNELSSSSVFPWLFNFSSSFSLINLCFNKLQGTIPDVITNMPSLSHLSLCANQFEGGFPISLGNMSSLTVLDLSNNQLSGTVPHLALSSSLEQLDLHNNMFNGKVTRSIGNLSKLGFLYLGSNNFEDIITETHFFNLSQLKFLDLSSNPLLSFNFNPRWNPPFQLNYVSLRGCKVGPHFPTWLGAQKNLGYLDFSDAGILDTLNFSFTELFPMVNYINLSHNNIHGGLPDLSSNFPSSAFIDLSFNHFNGSLPMLPHAAYKLGLDLSNNKFQGQVTVLCNKFMSWDYLDLSNNLLSGQIPDCFANLSTFNFLKLAHNNFSGKIPSVNVLSSLHLQNNSFTGEIPTSLRNCTFLHFIDLSENKLTGNIPMWIGDSLTRLVFLSLRSNELFGSIPPTLCQLAHTQVLDLSLNKISGAIPKCINNFTAMIQNEDYEANGSFVLNSVSFESAKMIWKGKELEYINTLKLVKLIDLSSNNLVGSIPVQITSLVTLVGLNLSRNNLSGFLPSEFGRLRSLDFLDLSRNHFDGRIPAGLSQMDQLGVLDLSYNNLSGRIPQSIHLRTFNASVFEGNPGLCGLPLTKACPGDEIAQDPKITGNANAMKIPEKVDKLIGEGFYISIAIGFIFGFWGVCGSLLFNTSWRIAFFKLWNSTMDWLYVKIAISKIRLREAYHKFVKF